MSSFAADFSQRIRAAIAAYHMLRRHEPLLVAVSGGPDSVCMLHVLLEVGHSCEVAHLNHQTRAGASDRDADFVRKLCQDLRLTLHETSQPIEVVAADSSQSFEMLARRVRYQFFSRVAADSGLRVLATGHHRGDQAETVLMRILRGASPGALGGILPVATRGGLKIVRPLCEVSREEIIAYLDARQLPYCLDASNESLDFTRNRVRNELLPYLRQAYNPRVDDALVRIAEMQRIENDFLDNATDTLRQACVAPDGAINRERFANAHPALQRRLLVSLLREHGIELDFDQIANAATFLVSAQTAKRFDLGGGYLLVAARDSAVITRAQPQDSSQPDKVVLGLESSTRAFGKSFRLSALPERPPNLADYCDPGRQVFDADRLRGPIQVRRMRPGDHFRPLGLRGTKKLSDYLSERGVPVWQRSNQLLVLNDGQIAWVVGGAVDEAVAITDRSSRFLEIEVQDEAR